MVVRLYLIREHRLHGIVTGVETVRIMSSNEDNLDRLLVSFKDAKVGFSSVFLRSVKLIGFCLRSPCWNGLKLFTTFSLSQYTPMNVHHKWFVY